MRVNWEATAELTGQIRENKSYQIDILVKSPGYGAVVIENEYEPARTVNSDARSRLGKTLNADGSLITQVVELVTPRSIRDCRTFEEVENQLHVVEFQYALLQVVEDHLDAETTHQRVERIPANEHSYLSGSIETLADFLANAGLSSIRLAESIRELDFGVKDSIGILSELAKSNEQLQVQIANLMMQAFSEEDLEQGLGIAVTVIINATLFQQRLSHHYTQVLSLAQMKANESLNQAGLIEQWKIILKINYWPVFSVAISVMYAIADPWVAARFVSRLFSVTQKLLELGIVYTHDLCGVVFQRFMTERKHLASFYTRPESATLLAYLAIPERTWQDEKVYRSFKFADFACGTGALVYSVYRRIAFLCEYQGGDPQRHHAHMMENNITAADIVPSAAHLTATLMSSTYPEKTYSDSRIVVPSYGLSDDGKEVNLGSLELLAEEGSFSTVFPNAEDTIVLGPKEATGLPYSLLVSPGSQDLVIMNPPFTRAMSDWIDSAHGSWKPFKALGNTLETQQRMRAREKFITRNIDCYNGYQSMPSAFCGIADHLLKDDGMFAFVLPSTSLQGISWRGFRAMLSSRYGDILVVSIAGKTAADSAWSADTKLAEVLIVARKQSLKERTKRHNAWIVLVNLLARPANAMLAAQLAARIRRIINRENLQSISSAPRGGTILEIGGEPVGELISIPRSEEPWPDVGIRDFSIAQCARHLAAGTLWFPTRKRPATLKLPIRKLGAFATIGFADNNVANNQRAAFRRTRVGQAATFPMIWQNSSCNQRNMLLAPDQEGRVIQGRDELAFRIWARRSRSLIAREVAWKSQALVTGYAETEVIGGRGWPNIQFKEANHEKAFVLWGNSTLGAIQYWYRSSRQQVRRSIVTVSSIAELPWLDPTALSDVQLTKIDQIFKDLKLQTLQPLNQMCNDVVRKELDHRLLGDVLGMSERLLGSVAALRKKFCSEPAIC